MLSDIEEIKLKYSSSKLQLKLAVLFGYTTNTDIKDK